MTKAIYPNSNNECSNAFNEAIMKITAKSFLGAYNVLGTKYFMYIIQSSPPSWGGYYAYPLFMGGDWSTERLSNPIMVSSLYYVGAEVIVV